MKQFNKLYNLILESLEQYQPPYNEQQMRQNGYDQETIQRLKNDPAHSWRMQTGLELIHRQPTKTQLERIWKNWQRMTDDQKIVSDQKCIELFGCTNEELYNYLIPQYKTEQPQKGTIKYPIPQINSPDDLKNFYKNCTYSLLSGVPDNQTDWEHDWKLLSPDQILAHRVGICYDTAVMDDYFLTKWGIKHILLFASTKRSLTDDYDDDPTHMFNVYYDQKQKCWKWLEGSWKDFCDNDWRENNSDTLIRNIGRALANDLGQTYSISVITKVPPFGVNMRDFHHFMKNEIMNPQFEIDPDLKEDLDVLTLNPFVVANIKDNKVYCCRPFKYERLEGQYTSEWSGERGNVFVTPFKGIASCFVISRNRILREFQKLGYRIQNCNFKYDVWNFPNEQLIDVADIVKVTIDKSGVVTDKVICGISTGYLYTIDYQKYKDHCHMFNKNPNSDVEFCIQGDVDYQSVQEITVKWTCNIEG